MGILSVERPALRSLALALVFIACASLFTGCSDTENEIDEDTLAVIDALVAQNAELTNTVQSLTVRLQTVEARTASMTAVGTDLYFDGVNVYIRSGAGKTDAAVNGVGNLILGYNKILDEDNNPRPQDGSHNIVIGDSHSFTSFAGIVAGYHNAILAPYCTVNGEYSQATAKASSVNGGGRNVASGIGSAILGGFENASSGDYSVVSGGLSNRATGVDSSISGGVSNIASGTQSSVNGGKNNHASGIASTVSGGLSRTASGVNSWRGGTLYEAY